MHAPLLNRTADLNVADVKLNDNILLYISQSSRFWRRVAQPEQIAIFVTFLGKALK